MVLIYDGWTLTVSAKRLAFWQAPGTGGLCGRPGGWVLSWADGVGGKWRKERNWNWEWRPLEIMVVLPIRVI